MLGGPIGRGRVGGGICAVGTGSGDAVRVETVRDVLSDPVRGGPVTKKPARDRGPRTPGSRRRPRRPGSNPRRGGPGSGRSRCEHHHPRDARDDQRWRLPPLVCILAVRVASELRDRREGVRLRVSRRSFRPPVGAPPPDGLDVARISSAEAPERSAARQVGAFGGVEARYQIRRRSAGMRSQVRRTGAVGRGDEPKALP